MASFSVVSNIASNNAQANLDSNPGRPAEGVDPPVERLPHQRLGRRRGRPVAVANTYRNDNAVITQGIRNANDGLSVLQVKDGALSNVSTLLDRLSTLATQAASAGTSGVSVTTLQDEADAIVGEIKRELNVAGFDQQKNVGVFISNDTSSAGSAPADTFTTAQYNGAVGDGTGPALVIAKDTDGTPVLQNDVTVTDATLFAAADNAERIQIVEDAIKEQLYQEHHADYSVVRQTDGSWVISEPGAGANVGQVEGTLKAIDLKAAGGPAGAVQLDIEKVAGGFLDLAGDAAGAVAKVASALAQIGTVQGTIGTLQNKLTFAVSLAQSQQVNKKAAESRIRDANIAEESANMTRYNILTQSGIAALAQANQSTSSVLSLLR